MQQWVKDLNAMYRAEPALFVDDYNAAGFEWIDAGDAGASVFSLLRKGGGRPVVVVLNLTPVTRPGYRIGVPEGGAWEILLNSDDGRYWGSGAGPSGAVEAVDVPMHGRATSVALDLPPLGVIFVAPAD
jgi:1,4-alpha-glucan branching enzyme